MSELYYLLKGEEHTGPFTLGQLSSMWRSGAISADTYFWYEGLPEWHPILAMEGVLDPTPVQPQPAVAPPPPKPKPPPLPPPLPVAVILPKKSLPAQTSLPDVKEYNLFISEAGRVDVSYSTLAGAKQALKELKKEKKAYQLDKKNLQLEARKIHQNYTQYTRNRGHMFRGGGGFGRVIRIFEASSRDAHKHRLAEALRPIERKIDWIDSIILAIEQVITEIDFKIQNS